MVTDLRICGRSYTIDTKLTAMQNFRRLPEGIRAEVIDGKLYVSPAPTIYHHDVVLELFRKLYPYVKHNQLGFVTAIPEDVYIKKANAVIPDIFFVSRRNRNIRREKRGFIGAPDLTIEVLSPSNKKYDRTIKKNAYRRAGVKEYWIIDPETKIAEGYRLKRGTRIYKEPIVMTSKIHIGLFDRTFRF
ncbi:MAG TPA: Uma2 family endonuclease [Cyclobacteriaceae bacterium]|nr:Uma2 family endonuclease [Cyclobacteriaceae bacterium]